MAEAFSFVRDFDYVRLEGLRRITGCPAHEWDIYILKELIDNALDADETSAVKNNLGYPKIQIEIEYRDAQIGTEQTRHLFLKVTNISSFPISKVKDILDPNYYTSRKSFFKNLTRGAMGNALKTILGIPYTLHNRATKGWVPLFTPMKILSQGLESRPQFIIDVIDQSIKLDVPDPTPTAKGKDGTQIIIGVDEFLQEFPRTLADIKKLADLYHICNPHAEFKWNVEIGEKEWIKSYSANSLWENKFKSTAPITWYHPQEFRYLMGAYLREELQNGEQEYINLYEIIQQFGGFDEVNIKQIIQSFGVETFNKDDIEGENIFNLYKILVKNSPDFNSNRLGAVGLEHINATLSQMFDISGEINYFTTTDEGHDPQQPFVIEIAAALLKSGQETILSAVNFTPTYGDPFMGTYLEAPEAPNQPGLGLKGLLDAYGLSKEMPLLIFVHIICPNPGHNEFSKTQINHLIFRRKLGELFNLAIGTLLQEVSKTEEEKTQVIRQEIQRILGKLEVKDKFIFAQLVSILRARLKLIPSFQEWLNRFDVNKRLLSLIQYELEAGPYHIQLARTINRTICIPSHPNTYFTIELENFTTELLSQSQVNKVLYIQSSELEPIILENGWLCRLDMALIRNPVDINMLQRVASVCTHSTEEAAIKFLIIPDFSNNKDDLVKEIQNFLPSPQVIDIFQNIEYSNLMAMLPSELFSWFCSRLDDLHIPRKYYPDHNKIYYDLRTYLETKLLKTLWSDISQQLDIFGLMKIIQDEVGFTSAMIEESLDVHIKNHILNQEGSMSYLQTLSSTVDILFERINMQYSTQVKRIIQQYLKTQISD